MWTQAKRRPPPPPIPPTAPSPYAGILIWHLALLQGARLVILPSFDPDTFLKAIARPTVAPLHPTPPQTTLSVWNKFLPGDRHPQRHVHAPRASHRQLPRQGPRPSEVQHVDTGTSEN